MFDLDLLNLPQPIAKENHVFPFSIEEYHLGRFVISCVRWTHPAFRCKGGCDPYKFQTYHLNDCGVEYSTVFYGDDIIEMFRRISIMSHQPADDVAYAFDFHNQPNQA